MHAPCGTIVARFLLDFYAGCHLAPRDGTSHSILIFTTGAALTLYHVQCNLQPAIFTCVIAQRWSSRRRKLTLPVKLGFLKVQSIQCCVIFTNSCGIVPCKKIAIPNHNTNHVGGTCSTQLANFLQCLFPIQPEVSILRFDFFSFLLPTARSCKSKNK